MPSESQIAAVAELADALAGMRHGQRGALVHACAARLSVSAQTVNRWLRAHRLPTRKRRADAGAHGLTREEAAAIAATMREGTRDNGRMIYTLRAAVDTARADGRIRAERLDPETGELIPLSYSAIARAMRDYDLHPDQVREPRPYQDLSSPHPNWCWQVDASVCVVFYLPERADKPGGYRLSPIDQAVHYKNRPENLAAVEKFRVIRYVATDHNSGVIRVRYYPHSESASHTVEFLAWLIAPKNNPADPFHGVPRMVMVDPGATGAGMVRRFCEALGIHLIVNKAHNPRAKGQVEQGNAMWEKSFESRLRFVGERVRDFADLNALAGQFQLHFNATAIHRRHGLTRFEQWLTISREQLRITPPAERLLRLATMQAATPKVRGNLTVLFDGRAWDVREVPEVAIGGTVNVAISPFTECDVIAICHDGEGRVIHVPLPEVEKDESGFRIGAAVVGEEFKRLPDTAASANAGELSMLASKTATLKDDEAARRKKDFVPFGGEFNPFAEMDKAHDRHYLPRAGEDAAVALPVAMPRTLSAARAAMQAREALGAKWNEGMFEFIARRWSAGVDEDELARQIARWQKLGVGDDAITQGD
ncbi:MAG: hypothetical protein LBE85_14245 [Candidatus Accumulibacter sp.]|jgi:hypothetical protein|nr:hypothetical protein [Accumulibacter sp.]